MDRDELATQVIARIAKMQKTTPDKVSVDSTFEELGVDSLDAMEMLFLMEEQLDVNMPDTAVRAMRNVRQVVEALDKLLKGEELELPEPPATAGEEPQAEAG